MSNENSLLKSEKLAAADVEKLQARKEELEAIPGIETKFPENMELQMIKQRLDLEYRPPLYRPVIGGGVVTTAENGELEIKK